MKSKYLILVIILIVGIGLSGCLTKVGVIESEDQISEESEEIVDEDHEHEHDHFVEIEGSKMKNLTVKEVADLWEIDAEILLSEIIAEFDLKGDYTVDIILEVMRDAEYSFSPAIIKDLAEEIRNSSQN